MIDWTQSDASPRGGRPLGGKPLPPLAPWAANGKPLRGLTPSGGRPSPGLGAPTGPAVVLDWLRGADGRAKARVMESAPAQGPLWRTPRDPGGVPIISHKLSDWRDPAGGYGECRGCGAVLVTADLERCQASHRAAPRKRGLLVYRIGADAPKPSVKDVPTW